MSIHVCKCEHKGRTEYHLRYPGMTEDEAQNLADKINAGALASSGQAASAVATPAAPAQPRPKARQIISAFHQFRTGELNGFAAAVRHLWQVPPDDVRTPELAAHARAALHSYSASLKGKP